MAKNMTVRSDFQKAELVGNWMIRFNDPEKGGEKA